GVSGSEFHNLFEDGPRVVQITALQGSQSLAIERVNFRMRVLLLCDGCWWSRRAKTQRGKTQYGKTQRQDHAAWMAENSHCLKIPPWWPREDAWSRRRGRSQLALTPSLTLRCART